MPNRHRDPLPVKQPQPPKNLPTTLEEFFETISEQFGIEEEAEEEEDFFEPQEPIILKETAPSIEPTPAPIISLPSETASPTEQANTT